MDSTKIRNFKEIRPVGVELFHADGQTDMMKLAVAFLSFTNALKERCINIKFWQRNLKRRNHSENVGVNRRRIITYNFR